MHFRRLDRTIGRRSGRGGDSVLRSDEHHGAADALTLHQAIAFTAHQEIAGAEDRHVLVPQVESCILDQGGECYAGVVNDDVDAAIIGNGLFNGPDYRVLAGDVHQHAAHIVASIGLGKSARHLIKRCLVDIGQHHGGAF